METVDQKLDQRGVARLGRVVEDGLPGVVGVVQTVVLKQFEQRLE